MEAEIRGITSIVRTPPTDSNRSDEGRRRRIEEQNLAFHQVSLSKMHNNILCSHFSPGSCTSSENLSVNTNRFHTLSVLMREHLRPEGVSVEIKKNLEEPSSTRTFGSSVSDGRSVCGCDQMGWSLSGPEGPGWRRWSASVEQRFLPAACSLITGLDRCGGQGQASPLHHILQLSKLSSALNPQFLLSL